MCVLAVFAFPWIKYDLQYLRTALKLIRYIQRRTAKRDFAVDSLERQVRERPKQTFIIYQDNNYTYEFVDQKANQIARAALKLGLKPKDVAAIMMTNEPAFIWTYFGLQKIGVSVSLINYHLRHKALAHSITSCKPKILIVGQDDELTDAVHAIWDDVKHMQVVVHGPAASRLNVDSLSQIAGRESTDSVDQSYREDIAATDAASFIFTSGTTGLPKPAIITHRRTVLATAIFSSFDFNEHDILYETLPLYHSAGLVIGVFSVVHAGAVIVLRNKFSASNFWNDCRKHNVTVVHYIGEMCRYLVQKPVVPDEARHNIRVAVGNGLRKGIWESFTRRFRIPRVVEFYSATESVIGFANIFDKVGKVGRSSPLTRILAPAILVQFDHVTESAKRDADGRCIEIAKDSVGLLIAPVNERRTFEGYFDRPAENEKKLLYDVFKPGDVYFNTGDLFYLDNEYFVSFQDRTGDTYRWKGENVSTHEVSNVLSAIDFLYDANVYGVAVPGCEGKAGMVAIRLKDNTSIDSKNLQQISAHCAEQLPAYARPRFLRFQREVNLTSTFKHQKVRLVNDGFDPSSIDDPLYYFDSVSNQYKALTRSVYTDIVNGKITV
ncbi:very long-chain acyl-CoA synthetase-like [Haliotis rubra]|uniref:very long-chain acyl-CoA synthetase-like n=1 Tax=Haliotis rubra TaxID=36100 RepID=UPI001EE54267|nr:very long-chain acyl-CoA synthetase-like [Haliotis rubra]